MNYTVQYTETARADLMEIALTLYELTGNKETAAGYISGIRKACEILKSFPESGILPRDRVLVSMGYRFVQYKDYLAFYLTDDESRKVTVMAVFSGKRDYTRYMKKYIE